MWSIITHLIAFTAGTVAGVVLLCLMQAGKRRMKVTKIWNGGIIDEY